MAESQSKPGPRGRIQPAELIKHCQNRLAKHLLAYITPVFDETIEHLFEMAEKGIDTAAQNRLFESQRILRNKKIIFTEVFSEEIDGIFARYRDNLPDASESDDEDDDHHARMSLVEETDLEESLAISDMVSKAEIRFTQSIYALNQRLAILNGGRPVKNDSNPCGPLQIGRALRTTAECLPVDVEFKVKLYHRFDRQLQKNMGECYDEMNGFLAEAGVLPNIRFKPVKKARRPSSPAAPPSPEENGVSEFPEQGMDPGFADGTQDQYAPLAPGGSSAPASGGQGGVDFFGRAMAASQPGVQQGVQPAGQAGGQQVPGAGSPQHAQGGMPAGDMLQGGSLPPSQGLRQLLSNAAASGLLPSGHVPGNAAVAPSQQLQVALSDLQSRLSRADVSADGRIGPQEIKRNLAESLGVDPTTGKPMALAERDSQTIDIMGMLYEHIERENLLQRQVQDLLHKLQVPMIRVALQEDDFLDNQEHPARKFFNTVADSGELWLEDKASESKTFGKMQTAIDRILDEYRGDNEVFKDLLSDLDKHIQLLSKKATLAEKRHVEAARGQEKLEDAREQARRLIERLVKKYNPPKFVESVLSQPWCDVLALTVLRHGDDSEQWREALTVAKVLIFSVRDDLDEKVRANLRKRVKWLRKQLSSGLNQVGYYEQDVQALLSNMDACHRWSLAEEKSEDLPEALSTPIAGPDPVVAGAKKPKTPVPKKPELSESEKAMMAKVRLLPFGTWFELQLGDDNEWLKRKLSWYSPLTGRCLFVNNRGAVAEDMNLYELSQRMAKGSARVFRPNSKPLIDRALDAIFGRLKKLTSRSEPA